MPGIYDFRNIFDILEMVDKDGNITIVYPRTNLNHLNEISKVNKRSLLTKKKDIMNHMLEQSFENIRALKYVTRKKSILDYAVRNWESDEVAFYLTINFLSMIGLNRADWETSKAELRRFFQDCKDQILKEKPHIIEIKIDEPQRKNVRILYRKRIWSMHSNLEEDRAVSNKLTESMILNDAANVMMNFLIEQMHNSRKYYHLTFEPECFLFKDELYEYNQKRNKDKHFNKKE